MKFEIVCGYDNVEIDAEKARFIKKHYTDDMNFTELARDSLSPEAIKSAVSSSPMMADSYLAVIEMDRNSFSKHASLLVPHKRLALMVVLRGHMLSKDAVSSAVTLKAYPYPARKDLIAYAGSCGKERGIDLNMDERKMIVDLFPDKNSICKTVFQLSLLPPFDRKNFLISQADTKRMYKWEIVAAIAKGDIKAFTREYYSVLESLEGGRIQSLDANMQALGMIAGMLDALLAGNANIPESVQSRADTILTSINLQSFLSFAVWDLIAELRTMQFLGKTLPGGVLVFIIRRFSSIIKNMESVR